MSAAVAASAGPGGAAAGARSLALPGQKLLHRGQVPRARCFEKFLLLSHRGSQGFSRRRGQETKSGAPDWRMEFLRDPPPPPPPSRPQVISHYCRPFGEETKAPSADGSVCPDPRCRWRESLVGSTVPASSKLPPAGPPSSVRHFLGTTLFFGTYKSKTLRATRHPHPSCSIKKWMGITIWRPSIKSGSHHVHHARE